MSADPTAEVARPRKPGQLYAQNAVETRKLTVEIGPYYGHWVAALVDEDGQVAAIGQHEHKFAAIAGMIRDLERQALRYGHEWAGVAREREGARS